MSTKILAYYIWRKETT